MDFLFSAHEATKMMRFKNLMKRELGETIDLPRLSTEMDYATSSLLRAREKGSEELATIAGSLLETLENL